MFLRVQLAIRQYWFRSFPEPMVTKTHGAICQSDLTHWGRVTHICVSKLTTIGRWWLVAWMEPSHYPNQCEVLNETNFWSKFIQENAFEIVVCKIGSNLSRPECVNVYGYPNVKLITMCVQTVLMIMLPWCFWQPSKKPYKWWVWVIIIRAFKNDFASVSMKKLAIDDGFESHHQCSVRLKIK